MINKQVTNVKEALKGLSSGMTLMLGGFGLCGIPENAISEMVDMDVKDLICISNNLRHSGAKDQLVYKEIITGYPYEFTNPIAGKTGTTQNQSDGWFMGMVPNLVTGVWVGGEDRSTHFKTITYGQGASMALPIWANFMRSCYEIEDLNISKEEFSIPEDLTIQVDCAPKDEDGKRILEGDTTITPDIDF